MDLYSGQMEVQTIVEKGVKVEKKGKEKTDWDQVLKNSLLYTLGQNHAFCTKIHLNFVKNETLKMRFLLKNSGLENVNILKNVILKMWFFG